MQVQGGKKNLIQISNSLEEEIVWSKILQKISLK